MKMGDKIKCELVFEVTDINEELATVSVVSPHPVFEERGLNNLEVVLNQMQLLDGTKIKVINKDEK